MKLFWTPPPKQSRRVATLYRPTILIALPDTALEGVLTSTNRQVDPLEAIMTTLAALKGLPNQLARVESPMTGSFQDEKK